MNMFRAVDMREGNPVTQIIRFSIPMLLGNVAQQLYNTVDSIIVGRFVGDNALAAVGSAGPILNLMIVLFIGISVGASIMVSQYFGAQKREELSKLYVESFDFLSVSDRISAMAPQSIKVNKINKAETLEIGLGDIDCLLHAVYGAV